MIGGGEPVEVGPLHHHGPELYPVIELIVGPGLPVAAAIVLGRWRSVRRRLSGGATTAGGDVRRTGSASVEVPLVKG